jgi:hypothetical protein
MKKKLAAAVIVFGLTLISLGFSSSRWTVTAERLHANIPNPPKGVDTYVKATGLKIEHVGRPNTFTIIFVNGYTCAEHLMGVSDAQGVFKCSAICSDLYWAGWHSAQVPVDAPHADSWWSLAFGPPREPIYGNSGVFGGGYKIECYPSSTWFGDDYTWVNCPYPCQDEDCLCP